MINIYVGYDPREAAVFHVFNQSVIENSTTPVSITPLAENLLQFDGQQDGTNGFIFSRYLVPQLQDYKGWAIFCDGDMHVTADITELFALRDESKAVMVVKHDYQTRSARKYIGTPIENNNVDYPRKNWSSVILFNCAHPSNRVLTRGFVEEAGGAVLHRFGWLNDDEIGDLPVEWNHLVGEYEPAEAKLYHHTLGSPGFEQYSRCESHEDWNSYLLRSLHMVGEWPSEMVRRATWRSNASNKQPRHSDECDNGLPRAGRPHAVRAQLHSER